MREQQPKPMALSDDATQWIDTPMGAMRAVANRHGIVRLQFDLDEESASQIGSIGWQCVEAERHLSKLSAELAEYFAGKRTDFSVPVVPSGSDFERRAWEFLRGIPFGQTRSYGQQARAIDGPNAARAVGGANGRNPIAIVIPCHRVIGSDGSLTGFASGLERKRWLLEHEGVTCPAEEPLLFNA